MDLESPVSSVKGIGEKTASAFAKMGVYTVGDILLHFPRDYVKYPEILDIREAGELQENKKYAIHAVVGRTVLVKYTRSMPVTILNIGEPGRMLELIWFRKPYLKHQLQHGKHFIFYGPVSLRGKSFVMEQPVVYEPEAYEKLRGSLQPVYSLTKGITNNLMTKTVKKIMEELGQPEAKQAGGPGKISADSADLSPAGGPGKISADNADLPPAGGDDYLPADLRQAQVLPDFQTSLRGIHFPKEMEELTAARQRLVFDEFFLFLLAMHYQRGEKLKPANEFSYRNPGKIGEWMEKLPFSLTDAQKRTLEEIRQDLSGPTAAERLIQGDVGSGKTIVAFLAMAWTSANGYQSAIMAPTEVLARQHYENFKKNCDMLGLKIPIILITGSLTARQKREAYERLALYPNAIVVGTHALIQDKVNYDRLALVITDEQHRFGVNQRRIFAEKGSHPHILVMSATPIPRTLAIILYGGMDISVIDQVPARRLPIKNCVVGTGFRNKAYEFIEKQVLEGHQAYVICPLVEETENMEGENVTDYVRKLRDIFPEEISLGLLHGKQKNALKDSVMQDFSANKIQVLVSTTVVEVGVDVPNATVMMIENADRFGLAQLHQLRGRVGRGDAQSYCIFINTSDSKNTVKRLDILSRSNDGFFIAGQDLKLRGPGDFFGIRQSGDLCFQLADIYQDAAVLSKASEAVKKLLASDPDLLQPEHQALKARLGRYKSEEDRRMNL